MASGYSGTPLNKKLGIKEDSRVALIRVPDSVVQELSLRRSQLVQRGQADVVVACCLTRAEYEKDIVSLGKRVFPNGAVWIGWPKKASGIKTDMLEQTIRDVCLPMGLVDNKVCAIDETWSGLRLVWRLELRNP